ncbi:S8 family serine peptidase [Flavobacterium suzhouense]|uniref:S8 family serine peptidase n=1 Tax=Flavobacterium suzhouense TaxID=1529638 RepID=A0ABW5NWV9_9FLAO
MKKVMLLILLFTSALGFAQEDAWIYFKDKPDADYYLANPTEMLSQKALDRRARQNILLDEKDIPIHADYLNVIKESTGVTVMSKSKWLNAIHVRGERDNIELLKANSFVDHIDYADKSLNTSRISIQNQVVSANKNLETQIDFNYGNSANQIQMLNGQLLHQSDYTGKGITIAVLDAGFPGVNTTQPFQRMRDNGQIKGGYDFVARSEDYYQGGTHGTLVLSTMAGYVEGQLTGTAPDAFYYLFRTEDATSENPVEESYWVEAAEAADSLGVDIINTSLGYFVYDNGRYSHTYEQMDGQTAFITRGADIAVSRGIFCVVSAGNSANTINPHIPAPADAPGVLTVGAVDLNEMYVSFSSIGPTADNRLKPDVMAKGYQATLATPEGTIGVASGTSFSSPITAGLVACLWQALPDKTNTELRELIKESADRYSEPNNQYGYGIPDFSLAMQKAMGLTDGNFIVYPNPANDIVHLLFPKNIQRTTVTIFNELGQRVSQQNVTLANPSFDVSQLATGIYSYSMEGTSQKGRIIKQ